MNERMLAAPIKRPRTASTAGGMAQGESVSMSKRNRTGIESRNGRHRGYVTVGPKKLRGPWADSVAEARSWRVQAMAAKDARKLTARTGPSLREAALAWIEMAEAGQAVNRSGDLFKPNSLRDYRSALERHIIPNIGASGLSEVTTGDVQRLADRLALEGLGPSGVRNALMPLRGVYRYHAIRDGIANPTRGVQLPAVRGRRDRIASPAEAARLIAAVPASERAFWAAAFYAGLRSGELRALRWEDVNVARGVIRVRRNWDEIEGEVTPKSAAGERVVPIPTVLAGLLVEHGMDTRRQRGLVFGTTEHKPFTLTTVRDRARKAWKAAGLEPITTHEARHTFASMAIAAGVNAKQLSTYMGHASIAITYDRYGHLLPGDEAEAAGLMDDYLARGSDR